MKRLVSAAVAGIITGMIAFSASGTEGHRKYQPPPPPAQYEVIGIMDSRTNPKMAVLVVACLGKTYGFEFPKSMLQNDEAMEHFLEGTVIPKLEKVCR